MQATHFFSDVVAPCSAGPAVARPARRECPRAFTPPVEMYPRAHSPGTALRAAPGHVAPLLRLLAPLLLLASAAGGCSSDMVGVRLIVTTDLALPDEMDWVRVTVVAAARTPTGPLCRPTTVDATVIPFEFLVTKGTQFTGWVAFRVEGLLGGVTILLREMLVRWPDEGVLDVPVPLEASCLDLPADSPCRDREDPLYPELECIAGRCVGKQAPGVFETEPELDAPDCLAP